MKSMRDYESVARERTKDRAWFSRVRMVGIEGLPFSSSGQGES